MDYQAPLPVDVPAYVQPAKSGPAPVIPAYLTGKGNAFASFLPSHITDTYATLNRRGQVSTVSYDFSISALPTTGYYWAYQVNLTSGDVAYIGFLNRDCLTVTMPAGIYCASGYTGGIATFAVWNAQNATAVPDGSVEHFTNEGIGWRARVKYNGLTAGATYNLSLSQSGDVITGTITDKQTGIATSIGSITAPAGARITTTGGSWLFSEVYADVDSAADIAPVTATFSNFMADGVAGYSRAFPYQHAKSSVDAGVAYGTTVTADHIYMSTGGTTGVSTATSANDAIYIDSKPQTVNAGAGNDTIYLEAGSTNNTIDGGSGIDIVVFPGPRASYGISKSVDGIVVAGPNNTLNLLKNVERLQFSDYALAFDLDGNAGIAVKALGVAWGKSGVANRIQVGGYLRAVDRGVSIESLMIQGLAAQQASSNSRAVTLMYYSLFGFLPAAADLNYLLSLIDNGAFTLASMARYASEMTENITNINFRGLVETGVAYQ